MCFLTRVNAAATRLAILCGALVLAVPSTSGAGDWPRYGGDDLVTNHVPAAAAAGLSSETVGDIVTRWSVNVGGRFVASPLYAADFPFGGKREDAIFVATNAGTVAALRAVDGAVLWKRQVSADDGSSQRAASPTASRRRRFSTARAGASTSSARTVFSTH